MGSGVAEARDVFISHTEQDGPTARSLAAELRALHLTTWTYEEDGVPGISYLTQIHAAIEGCQAFVLLASAKSVNAHQVIREVERAHEREKVIIPVRIGMSHQQFIASNPILTMACGTAVTLAAEEGRLSEVAQRIAAAVRLSTSQAEGSRRQPPETKPVDPPTIVAKVPESVSLPSAPPSRPEVVEEPRLVTTEHKRLVPPFLGHNESSEGRAGQTSPAALAPEPAPLEILRSELRSGYPIIPRVTKLFGTGDSLANPCFIMFEELTEADVSALPSLIASWKENKKYAQQSFVLAYVKASGASVPGSQVDEIRMALTADDPNVLEDLALVTGGMFFSTVLGMQLKSLEFEYCGFAKQLQVLNSGVRVVGPAGKRVSINGRASQLANGIRRQRNIEVRERYRLRYEGLTGDPITDLPDYSPLIMPADFDLQLEGGWASPYFVTEPDQMVAELTDPFVIVSTTPLRDIVATEKSKTEFVDRRIGAVIIPDSARVRHPPRHMSLPIGILGRASSLDKDLLVLGPGFGSDALATMVVNKLRGILRGCAVELKHSNKRDLETLAAKLKVIPFESSAAEENPERLLGTCKKVICHQDTCFMKL